MLSRPMLTRRGCSRRVEGALLTLALTRHVATASQSSPVTAALLLSRPPLLTPSTTSLESAYYDHASRVHAALSQPPPTQFYFKPGSLPMRRFQRSQHASDVKRFGPALAGKAPEVGDVQPEPELVETSRLHWAGSDAARGEKSLDREPEGELFCLIKRRGRWGLPSTVLRDGESLDEAVRLRITGVDGDLDGKQLDSWLVTRKPVGVFKGRETTFIMRSHVLAGEIAPSPSSEIESWAWLTVSEVGARIKEQGEEEFWIATKSTFGLP